MIRHKSKGKPNMIPTFHVIKHSRDTSPSKVVHLKAYKDSSYISSLTHMAPKMPV